MPSVQTEVRLSTKRSSWKNSRNEMKTISDGNGTSIQNNSRGRNPPYFTGKVSNRSEYLDDGTVVSEAAFPAYF